MGRILEKREKEEVNLLLDKVTSLAEQIEEKGIPFEEGKEEILKALRNYLDRGEAVQRTPSKRIPWDFSKEKLQTVFAEDSRITLRPMAEGDQEFYYSVYSEYAYLVNALEGDSYKAIIWNQAMAEEALTCVIERVEDGAKIGYIGVKDTSEPTWELVIELKKDYCGKHYGRDAIQMFFDTITEITGEAVFRARVEVDNIPCQNCMDAIGARLIGICNILNYPEEFQNEYEEQNLDQITPHMCELAEKLQVEPRKLLSHVLEYHISF